MIRRSDVLRYSSASPPPGHELLNAYRSKVFAEGESRAGRFRRSSTRQLVAAVVASADIDAVTWHVDERCDRGADNVCAPSFDDICARAPAMARFRGRTGGAFPSHTQQ